MSGNGEQGGGVSVPVQAVAQAAAARCNALNQENLMLQARVLDLEEQAEQARRLYTELLAVCPEDVVAAARGAGE